MSTDPVSPTGDAESIAAEQRYVDKLFEKLDTEVSAASARLADVAAQVDPATPDADALVRRETEYHGLQAKLDRLNIAQLGLVFGRIDIDAPGDNPTAAGLDRRYIGRLGLDDRQDDYRTLLLDWRAPMARPFYLATTAHPEGVYLRRHIRTSGRTVTALHDEYLTAAAAPAEFPADTLADVAGEAALVHALEQARTRHMSSIVETIQREQDDIIRDPHRGVMVVEGGPGTGKTAVALHRVAYLLYTHRQHLGSAGVLIIGPNSTFLDYISRVLPELGETGVVLSTIADLYPGITPHAQEPLLGREIKGSAAMVDILRTAVKAYQTVPTEPITVRIDGIDLEITPRLVTAARTRARRSRLPHNQARGAFADRLCEQLAQQLAQRIGADPLGGTNLLSEADIDQLHDDLSQEPAILDLIEEFWPRLAPTTVLAELLSDPHAIAVAAAEYDHDTQAGLLRPPGRAGDDWTASDTALLDELSQLIGMPDPQQLRAEHDAQWREQVAEAEGALDILASSISTDNDDDLFEAEILSAHDVIDAEQLARRQEVRDHRSTAQRARADHTWAYGHIIVDEAQELSPMEWRMLFRRSPSRWMTLVGDPAQTSAPAGVDSWSETLEPFIGQRLRRHHLTVNYRTPEPITEVANSILALIDPDATPATALRSGAPVTFLAADAAGELRPGLSTAADGRLHAVISAENIELVKGLEFDHVVILHPREIVAASPQGLANLYVAITRATQTLTIYGDLP